jgi:bifunctional DNase/RNase
MSDQSDDTSVAAVPTPPVASSADPMEAALAVVRGDAARVEPGGPDGSAGPAFNSEAAGEPEPVAQATTVGDFRMAVVSAVGMDLPSQHPAVVLRETESPRRQLTFSVGFQDGVALSTALRRLPTPRPLTHELMADILAGFDVDVVAVRLVGRQGTTYFAELDLRGRNGRSVYSCRPTDALTLALRQPVPVPILIDARLFEVLGDVEPPGGA